MAEYGPVVVRLRGRLGNNLFQYALGRALTPEGPVIVDDLYTSHQPLLDAVGPSEVRLLSAAEAWAIRQPPRVSRGRRRLVRHLHDGTLPESVRRRVHAAWLLEGRQGEFDPQVLAAQPPVLLEGYFQNEDYFAGVADRIAAALRPPAELARSLAELRRAVGEGPTVAVVVRAGLDYEEAGWAHPLEWYLRAAAMAAETVDQVRFAVFSDVPLAAEAMACALGDLGPAAPMVRRDPVTQLHLIASMDHVVLAATSFGWWGAWLGDHRRRYPDDRLVIAPTPWLEPDLDGIVPARWTRLAR